MSSKKTQTLASYSLYFPFGQSLRQILGVFTEPHKQEEVVASPLRQKFRALKSGNSLTEREIKPLNRQYLVLVHIL